MESSLKAIAEPRRQDILRLVADAEMSAGDIATHFDISRPAISQHLQVLKGAGLISERRLGTKRFYRTRPEGLAELKSFLEQFWDQQLSRLASVAEADEARQAGQV